MPGRLAVVIGNSDYENFEPLPNPIKDAGAVKETFCSLGYEVFLGINLERNQILKHLNKIMKTWKDEATEIVFYYSGHGSSIDGKTYIVPVDAVKDVSIDIMEESLFSVETIIKHLLSHRRDNKLPIILILDCCRSRITSDIVRSYDQEDPVRNVGEKFGVKSNIAILYSTADGEVALDGDDGSEHSPYTQIFLESVIKSWTIYQINDEITKTLTSKRFGNKQVSWMYVCLHEPYRFKLSGIHPAPKDYHFYGVPPKNNNFVDRPEFISKMEDALGEGISLNGSNILALNGLGGMGKTQLMLRYCYLHHAKYSHTFWLEVDGLATTLDSFFKLAIYLDLDEKSAKEKCVDEKIIEWVHDWLEKKEGWLLLLNNADITMVTKLFKTLPRIGGDIILTTREYISLQKAKIITVGKMSEDEALSLLLGAAKMNSIDRKSSLYSDAKEIVTELDSMAFAVDLARAYVESAAISFEKYLSMFKNQRDILFSHQDKDNSYQYNHSLKTVWQLSFNHIRTQFSLAADLLDICAFLQPESIPVILFERQHPALTRLSDLISPSISLGSDCEALIAVREAVAILVKFSFVTRTSNEDKRTEKDPASDVLTIHRLIQKVVYNQMSNEQKMRWIRNLASALKNEIDFSDSYSPLTRTMMNAYLLHIRHFAKLLDVSQKFFMSEDLFELLLQTVLYLLDNGIYLGVEELAELTRTISKFIDEPENQFLARSLQYLADLYTYQGKYLEAEPLYQQALVIFEKALGPEHPSTATSLNNLAFLCKNQGHYCKAEPLYERALMIREKVLGPEDSFTATSLNSLAELYLDQGNYAKAESLCERALIIHEKTSGSDHPNTATSLNNLASLYKNQCKYVDAERHYQRALNIREKVLGTEHPNTVVSLNNLASLYLIQGKYTEAESLYKQALTTREKVLGPEHPDTAISLNNLASLYDKQGKYAYAEPLYKRALVIRERVLGPEHPDTATSLNNLASLYNTQDKYTDAMLLCERALAIREKTLGPEHPNTANSLNTLASLHSKQGKYADAEPLYRRALTIREKALGPDHLDTAISLNNLALLFDNQGKYSDARSLYQRALKIKENVLGYEHPDTAIPLNNMASLHQSQGNHADAEPLYQRALAIREKALGPEHPKTAMSLNNLAGIYLDQGNYAKAETLYKRALTIQEKVWGYEHPITAVSVRYLAFSYYYQAQYIDAKPLYKRALTIWEKALGPEHLNTAASLNDLASLYNKQGKNVKAKPLYQRALRIYEREYGLEHQYTTDCRNALKPLRRISSWNILSKKSHVFRFAEKLKNSRLKMYAE